MDVNVDLARRCFDCMCVRCQLFLSVSWAVTLGEIGVIGTEFYQLSVSDSGL